MDQRWPTVAQQHMALTHQDTADKFKKIISWSCSGSVCHFSLVYLWRQKGMEKLRPNISKTCHGGERNKRSIMVSSICFQFHHFAATHPCYPKNQDVCIQTSKVLEQDSQITNTQTKHASNINNMKDKWGWIGIGTARGTKGRGGKSYRYRQAMRSTNTDA